VALAVVRIGKVWRKRLSGTLIEAHCLAIQGSRNIEWQGIAGYAKRFKRQVSMTALLPTLTFRISQQDITTSRLARASSIRPEAFFNNTFPPRAHTAHLVFRGKMLRKT
jgi:hypothetical protein